jgi:ankyrin repeat protein
MKTALLPLLVCALVSRLFAADPLTDSIQKGLLEEEVNRNLEAAAEAYQNAVDQADAHRQTAATALFRLAEVYRKQGKTNDAVTAYQRVLRDFSTESDLVKMSRDHLALLGVAETAYTPAPTVQRQLHPDDVASLREELKLVELELQAVQKRFENGRAEAFETRRVRAELLGLQRQLPENASPERQVALIEEERKLAEMDLEEIRRKIEVGAAPPLDEIPVRRRILGLERELAAAQRGPATALATPTEPTELRPATPEENNELLRTQSIFRDSPDLVLSQSMLHDAAAKGYLAVVDYLLRNKMDVDPVARGETPLHSAVKAGHKRMCELLIQYGADVNARTGIQQTPLHLAANLGFREVAEVLLANGAQVNAKGYVRKFPGAIPEDEYRRENDLMDSTALHWAAERGFSSMIDLLLQHGAEIEATDRGGRTPLLRAVEEGKAPAAAKLLHAGANVNASDASGNTALSYAVKDRNLPMVELLLEHEPNLEARVTGLEARGVGDWSHEQWTVLFNSLFHEPDLQTTKLLLDHGANVNARAASGLTPVLLVVRHSFSKSLDLLLEHGADVNIRDNGDNTPLHYAIEYGLSPVVEKLLVAGADPNAPGWTALGAQPWYPLFRAVYWSGTRNENGFDLGQILTRLLLDHGANAQLTTSNGWTALHLTAQFGSVDLAHLLVEHGADVNARGAAPEQIPQMTPRFETARAALPPPGVPMPLVRSAGPVGSYRPGIVDFSHPPAVSAGVTDVTPLHVAAARGHAELAQFLLNHGALVNAADAKGHTALHFAANRLDPEMTRLLLNAHADPNPKSAEGETPLDAAKQSSRDFVPPERRDASKAVMKLLLEHGATDTGSDPAAREP